MHEMISHLSSATDRHLHGLYREAAGCGLPRKHHTVSAVEDSVGDVRRLCARRPRVLDHALQHLRRCDHRLAHLRSACEAFMCRVDPNRCDPVTFHHGCSHTWEQIGDSLASPRSPRAARKQLCLLQHNRQARSGQPCSEEGCPEEQDWSRAHWCHIGLCLVGVYEPSLRDDSLR